MWELDHVFCNKALNLHKKKHKMNKIGNKNDGHEQLHKIIPMWASRVWERKTTVMMYGSYSGKF